MLRKKALGHFDSISLAPSIRERNSHIRRTKVEGCHGQGKPRGFIGWTVAIIVIGVLWTGMGCQQAPQEGKTEKSSKPKATPTANIAPGPVQPVEETSRMPLNLVTGIIQVAKSNIPSVVHIEVTERQELANPFLPFEKDPKLRRYFGLPKKMPKKFERELVGIGTGNDHRPTGAYPDKQSCRRRSE